MGCMIPFTYCNRLRYDTGTMVSVDSKGLQSLDDNPFHQACHVTSQVFVWGQGSTKGSAVRRQEIKPETDAGSVVWGQDKGLPLVACPGSAAELHASLRNAFRR